VAASPYLLHNTPEEAADPRAPGAGGEGRVGGLDVGIQARLRGGLGLGRHGLLLLGERLLGDVVVGDIHIGMLRILISRRPGEYSQVKKSRETQLRSWRRFQRATKERVKGSVMRARYSFR